MSRKQRTASHPAAPSHHAVDRNGSGQETRICDSACSAASANCGEKSAAAAPPSPPAATEMFTSGSSKPTGVVGRTTVAGWLLGIAAILVIATSLHYEPPGGIRVPGFASRLPEICSSRRILGVDCPGCGLTRSFVLSAQQQWGRAFQIHPFGTIGFAFLMALVPYRVWQGWQLYYDRSPRSTMVIELSLLGALVAGSMIWWIVRLISGAAFG